jgi:hypothetical protein
MTREASKSHPLQWVVEPLIDDPSYLEKAMFGCRACYVRGQIVLVLAAQGGEEWQGLLVPTERAHHGSLLGEIPGLIVHPVLGKWLYLPEESEDFEESAQLLVDRISLADPRIGVTPKPRKPARRKAPGGGKKSGA